MQHTTEATKTIVDAAAVFTVIGTLSEIMPPLAAVFTITWTAIRIYETDTVQKAIGKIKADES